MDNGQDAGTNTGCFISAWFCSCGFVYNMTDDAQAWVFSEGLAWLQDAGGYAPEPARKILGRWGHRHGWKVTQSAIKDARMHNPRNPVSYVQAIIQAAPPEVDVSQVPPEKLRSDGLPLPTDEEREAMREKLRALKDELRRAG